MSTHKKSGVGLLETMQPWGSEVHGGQRFYVCGTSRIDCYPGFHVKFKFAQSLCLPARWIAGKSLDDNFWRVCCLVVSISSCLSIPFSLEGEWWTPIGSWGYIPTWSKPTIYMILTGTSWLIWLLVIVDTLESHPNIKTHQVQYPPWVPWYDPKFWFASCLSPEKVWKDGGGSEKCCLVKESLGTNWNILI